MRYRYNDGGRLAAGFKGDTGDCVVRSIAIATNKPYIEVYNEIAALSKTFNAKGYKVRGKSSPRTGVHKKVYHKYILSLGGCWEPFMKIGSGCKVHLSDDLDISRRMICVVSRHLTAVIDGVINDTFDPSRDGNRCVYGVYRF